MRWQKMDDDFLQTIEFVAFDTETTGLWAPANRIVELGAVKFRLGDNHPVVFQALVNPERQIPSEVVSIHGITDTMVKDCETVEPVLKRFVDFCGPESILIAHNALFDISFVGCEMDRVGVPLPQNHILDTVDISHKMQPGLDSYSLLSLSQELGISSTQSHRASDDATLVWKVFEQISEKFPYIKSVKDIRTHFPFYNFSQWQPEIPDLDEQYNDIQTAIVRQLRLEIMYASNGKPPMRRIIQPFRLHSLRGSVYVEGYCEMAEAERTFRIDRIKSFRLLTETR